jgi:hypothetical protein
MEWARKSTFPGTVKLSKHPNNYLLLHSFESERGQINTVFTASSFELGKRKPFTPR